MILPSKDLFCLKPGTSLTGEKVPAVNDDLEVNSFIYISFLHYSHRRFSEIFLKGFWNFQKLFYKSKVPTFQDYIL